MKYWMPIFILCAAFAACQSGADTSKNEQLIKRYFDHFNQHNWKAMAAMYTDSAAFRDPSFGKAIIKQNHVQVIQKYSELNKIFPDIKDEITQLYPSGSNHLIVTFSSTGTAPDGTKFHLPICTIFTIENGLITEDFTYYDNDGPAAK